MKTTEMKKEITTRFGKSGYLHKGYFIYYTSFCVNAVNLSTGLLFSSWTMESVIDAIDTHKNACFEQTLLCESKGNSGLSPA